MAATDLLTLLSDHPDAPRILSARFVSTMNVLLDASAITANTRSICSSETHSPKRSVMLHTKTRRGLRQRSGAASTFSSR